MTLLLISSPLLGPCPLYRKKRLTGAFTMRENHELIIIKKYEIFVFDLVVIVIDRETDKCRDAFSFSDALVLSKVLILTNPFLFFTIMQNSCCTCRSVCGSV